MSDRGPLLIAQVGTDMPRDAHRHRTVPSEVVHPILRSSIHDSPGANVALDLGIRSAPKRLSRRWNSATAAPSSSAPNSGHIRLLKSSSTYADSHSMKSP